MLRSRGWLAWTIVAYLLAAAAFELVLALRRATSPHGEGFVLLVALVAILAGVGVVFRRGLPAGLLAPAAACFVSARFFTSDPYYGSTFRRFADGGIFPLTWIYLLAGLALLAGVATHLWRRTPPVESAAVLLLLAFTALFMGTGH